MQALQGSLIGIPPSRLRSRIQAKAGPNSDAAQYKVISSGRSGPCRGLRKWTPGQKLISLPQPSDLLRASAGNAFGSSSPGDGSGLDPTPINSSTTSTSTSASKSDDSFCIIEGRDTVRDFAQLQLKEIRDNINSRRNKIFLLMEEVRRLRIQQRIKKEVEKGVVAANPGLDEDSEQLEFTSSIPFLPALSSASLQQYYATCFGLVSGIILFGGLLAPVLELKLGVGGTSYADFINSVHLPSQLSQVDPIVASFSGGAVGVISALMVVEVNNVKQHDRKRCHYCEGTGYLACARCSGSGTLQQAAVQSEDGALAASSTATTIRCANCAGAAKVMCPTCLCTGVALATEHDPRIDPFL